MDYDPPVLFKRNETAAERPKAWDYVEHGVAALFAVAFFLFLGPILLVFYLLGRLAEKLGWKVDLEETSGGPNDR